MSRLSTANYPAAVLAQVAGLDVNGNVRTQAPQAPTPQRVLLFGDSMSYYNNVYITSAWPDNKITHDSAGYLTWANRLLGQTLYLDPTLNKGVVGNTTTQMVARFASDVTANTSSFDIFILHSPGSNDIVAASTIADVNTAIANVKSIVASAQALGKLVFVILQPPNANFNTATLQRWAEYLNFSLSEWANTQPNVVIVDATRDVADPTSSSFAGVTAAFEGAGVHYTHWGAYLVGKRLAAAMRPYLPIRQDYMRSAVAYHATDNPTGNRLANIAFQTGSGGTITNGSGTLVGSWGLQRNSGSYVNGDVVASVSSFTAGYDSHIGKKQILTISMTGRSSFETVYFYQTVTGFSAGDVIELEACFDASNLTNLSRISAQIGESDLAQYPVNCEDGSGDYFGSEITRDTLTGIYTRTPRYTVQANGRTLFIAISVILDASTAATATLAYYDVSLRKVA